MSKRLQHVVCNDNDGDSTTPLRCFVNPFVILGTLGAFFGLTNPQFLACAYGGTHVSTTTAQAKPRANIKKNMMYISLSDKGLSGTKFSR
jgi:hypothetical protein